MKQAAVGFGNKKERARFRLPDLKWRGSMRFANVEISAVGLRLISTVIW